MGEGARRSDEGSEATRALRPLRLTHSFWHENPRATTRLAHRALGGLGFRVIPRWARRATRIHPPSRVRVVRGMTTVAALYIDPRGPYPKLPDVDCWDETRDARLYDGLHAVVAHPPCGPWGNLRHLYKGSQQDCGPRAVAQVRRWGGVLEHPAGSKLWDACQAHPWEWRDAYGGTTRLVYQCEWGHVARKPTWLYCVGFTLPAEIVPPFPGHEPTHWVSGGHNLVGRTSAPAHIKICSAQQRRRTPPLFAE